MQNDARSVDAQKQSGTSLDGNKKRFILPEPEVEENYLVKLIQLLESPIPTAAPAPAVSQKASSDDISGTKRGTIDPLVSKRPEKILNKKIKKKKKYKKWSKMVEMHPMSCVSRPLPEFGWVIRIQNAPDDFVPGTVPLRQKNAGGEVPLIFLYQVQCP